MGAVRTWSLYALSLLLLLPLLLLSPQSAEAKKKRSKNKAAATQTQPAAEAPKEAAPASAPPKTGPPQKAAAPPILLRPGLRFVIRPTLLGLVPPADETGYGECFVRVTRSPESANPGMSLYFEVKERINDSVLPRASQLDGVTDTRFRRGDISIADLNTAEGLMTPLDWGQGSFATQTGLLWLSRSAYDALLRDGAIPWPEFGRNAESQAQVQSDGSAGSIAELNTSVAGPDSLNGRQVTPTRLLVIDNKALYPCRVNGAMVDLPALRLADSQGRVDYWLFADPDNPLILKVSPRPDALPLTPAPEGQTASAARSASRRQDAAARVEQASPAGFGAGFALVEIDF